MMEQWFIKNKKADFDLIAKNFGISSVLARLAVNRGISNKEQLEKYLKPSFEYLHNAHSMKDIEKASFILEQKIKDIEFDMLRRGLSRSSIKEELVEKARQDASSQGISADWVLQLTLNELQLAEQNATQQKELALTNLQENFDAELAQKIAKISETVAKKIESTAKYNNTQEEKEADYKRSWLSSYIDAKQAHSEMARTLLTVSINDGYSVIEDYIRQDKATFTKDYYLAFDAREAYNELAALSQEYLTHLGETYYGEVLVFFANRM